MTLKEFSMWLQGYVEGNQNDLDKVEKKWQEVRRSRRDYQNVDGTSQFHGNWEPR